MRSFVQYSTRSFLTWQATLAKVGLRKMQQMTKQRCAVLAIASANIFACVGCNRTVLVSEASPIRLAEDCRCHVYVLIDGEWRRSDNTVTIPEGWWAVSPLFVDKADGNE